MGAFWAIWAIERWLKGGDGNRLFAALLCIAAIFSKESGLLVPLFFATHLVSTRNKDPRIWGALVVVAMVGIFAVIQLKVDITPTSEYGLSIVNVPRNLLALGFWLVAPPPWQTGLEWMRALPLIVGAIFWTMWTVLALIQYRRGDSLVLIALALVLLSLLPSALLDTHILPRYAYGAVAGLALCLARLISSRFNALPLWGLSLAAVVLAATTWAATEYPINQRHSGGRPVHRLVLKEELSRKTCRGLEKLGEKDFDHLVFLVDPAGDKEKTRILRESLGENLGPRLLLGKNIVVEWADQLSPSHGGALIISVTGLNLETLGYYNP